MVYNTMTREEYIKYRMGNNFTIICWNYYQRFRDKGRNLDYNSFIHYFQHWVNYYRYDYKSVVDYYNQEFGCTEVSKDNQLILIL